MVAILILLKEKFMKILAIITAILFVFLSGCEKKGLCDLGKKGIEAAASGIATTLECTNVDQIKADLLAPFVEAKVCESTAQGPIADIVCPLAAKTVVNYAASKIPEKWGCNPEKVKVLAADQVIVSCKQILGSTGL